MANHLSIQYTAIFQYLYDGVFQMFIHPQCSFVSEGKAGPHTILLQHSSLNVHRLPMLHRRMCRAVELLAVAKAGWPTNSGRALKRMITGKKKHGFVAHVLRGIGWNHQPDIFFAFFWLYETVAKLRSHQSSSWLSCVCIQPSLGDVRFDLGHECCLKNRLRWYCCLIDRA